MSSLSPVSAVALLAVTLVLTACQDAYRDRKSTSEETGGEPDTEPQPEEACHGVAFDATPLRWSLPEAIPSCTLDDYNLHKTEGNYRFFGAGCTGEFGWETIDLTGDGRLDLVVTQNEIMDPLGTRWEVYEGGPRGFSLDPALWSLPWAARPCMRGDSVYYDLYYRGPSSRNILCADVKWDLRDLDGDGLLDLVVFPGFDGASASTVRHWNLYRNLGHGFSETPIPWPLPQSGIPGYELRGFSSLGGSYWFQPHDSIDRYDNVVWGTMDMTGDGLPDLLVMHHARDLRGQSQWVWDLYTNTGAGFSERPLRWSLPRILVTSWNDSSTYRTSGSATLDTECEYQRRITWDTLDMTGDGRPDLVITAYSCERPGIGDSYWLLFANTGEGFQDQAKLWALPPLYPRGAGARPLPATSGWSGGECGDIESAFKWGTEDISGDGIADLVVSSDTCDHPEIGVSYWNVYEGTISGFEREPHAWTLPPRLPPGVLGMPFPEMDGSRYHDSACDGAGTWFQWTTTDLTADGIPDMLITESNCEDEKIGLTHWDLYPGLCEAAGESEGGGGDK